MLLLFWILTALSREGDRANRFLVGDVKQSIYRFRLADPTIFTGYEQRWRDGSGEGRRIALTDNFRSREGILNFVNPLFAALMRPMVCGVTYEALSFGDAKNRQALARAGDQLQAVPVGGKHEQCGQIDVQGVPGLIHHRL